MYKDDLQAQLVRNDTLERENLELKAAIAAKKKPKEKPRMTRESKIKLAKRAGMWAGVMAALGLVAFFVVAMKDCSDDSKLRMEFSNKRTELLGKMCEQGCSKKFKHRHIIGYRDTIYATNNGNILRAIGCKCIVENEGVEIVIFRPSPAQAKLIKNWGEAYDALR